MKLGALLDKQLEFQVYHYGDDADIKVFGEDIPLKYIVREYENAKKINEVYSGSVRVIDLLEIDACYGIVYEKIKGKTLLYELEDNPVKMDEIAKKFAQVHTELHQLEMDDFQTQESYLREEIENCIYISDEDKTKLLSQLENLPSGTSFCHGNYHLNNVFINHKEHIMDFSNAYIGHPMSDVAKACIIMSVPRTIDGGTAKLQEEVTKLRLQFVEIYKKYYNQFGNYNQVAMDHFYKFMAVTRLNKGHEIEREWLLDLIRS